MNTQEAKDYDPTEEEETTAGHREGNGLSSAKSIFLEDFVFRRVGASRRYTSRRYTVHREDQYGCPMTFANFLSC